MENLKWEAYEDSGGGLYLVILDGDKPVHIFENWEYCSEPGILSDAVQQLAENPNAFEAWDGDLMERLTDSPYNIVRKYTIEEVYETLGDLIADNDGLYINHMGFAARTAFNIPDDEEED